MGGSITKGALGRGVGRCSGSTGSGAMRSPHSPGSEWGSAQPPPALPAPGAGSEPIKSWNKPPPLLLPKASSRPFLLLSPRPGMFFPDFGPRVSRVSSSSKPLASPFTLKHHPLLHKGQASLLEATSSPFSQAGAPHSLLSWSLHMLLPCTWNSFPISF